MSKDFKIEDLQNKPEGQFFDRKSARKNPKEILKPLLAFANASGGLLVIGIEDNGKITGFSSSKAHEVEEFIHTVYHVQKQPIPVQHSLLQCKNCDGKDDQVLLFDVRPSTNKVIESNDGQAYLRSKDESLTLSYEQRKQLEYDKGQVSFEDEVQENSSIQDLDQDLLAQYKKHLNTDLSIIEILEARNFINRNGNITNAGLLLFSKYPTKFFPNSRIKFIKYDGIFAKTGKDLNIVKELNIEGPIPYLIQESREIINSQLREFQILDNNGTFSKITEYPEFAWFEGIVNAVTHRNYSINGDYIRVTMFDDRLEIFSPGPLPNIVNLQNIKTTRYSRNPRIARVLSEFGWVKELNEGVKRIFNEMEKYFLNDPIYSEPDHNSVLLTLENNILQRQSRELDRIKLLLSEDTIKSLTQNEIKVLQYIYSHKKINTSKARELLNKSAPYTRTLLQSLVEKGVLEWNGNSNNDPTQYFCFK
ncbi:ATP-binding protein [Aggregatibacter aphrophilus]|uniref:ATP-binding protein n=1 Tax=Aggregatibacter aphrophilus TaxID=732 RepID=UPI000D65AC35|nr:ATP-binding protein [Aggregatibacter aphrophilus]